MEGDFLDPHEKSRSDSPPVTKASALATQVPWFQLVIHNGLQKWQVCCNDNFRGAIFVFMRRTCGDL